MSFNVGSIGVLQNYASSAFGDLSTTQNSPRIQLQFPYNINTEEVNVAVSGAGAVVTHGGAFAICRVTASTSSSRITSRNNLHYRAGQGGAVFFTAVFSPGVSNSAQLVGLGDSSNGFFFGYNGSSFGINRRYGGVDNWIDQSSWNGDPMNGSGSSQMTLSTTYGNVYKIQYQWLGFGAVNFFIENSDTGNFALAHQIKYANSSSLTSVQNPSLPLMIEASNQANATALDIKVSSIAAFVEGMLINTGLNFCTASKKSIPVTVETNLITIRNNSQFAGNTNRKYVSLLKASLVSGSAATSDATFNFYMNNPLTGTSYVNVSTTTSVVSYDTTGTFNTSSRLIATFYVNGGFDSTIDLSALNITLNPPDTLTVTVIAQDNNKNQSCSLMWIEQF